VNIDSLVIEVTRRCNLECAHCLRGDSESIDLNLNYVKTLFKHLKYISTITFTGGEPSLVPDKISGIIDIAKRMNVIIGSFYIATNAVHASDKFLISVIKLYSYCDDNEISALNYSNDEYHEMNPKAVDRLKVFSFTSAKYIESPRYENILAEGRAENWTDRIVKPDIYDLEDGDIRDGTVYLNCEGNIIAGCDFSYKNQRDKNNIICHVDDFSVKRFKRFRG